METPSRIPWVALIHGANIFWTQNLLLFQTEIDGAGNREPYFVLKCKL